MDIGSTIIDLGYKDKWLITTFVVVIMGLSIRWPLCLIIEAYDLINEPLGFKSYSSHGNWFESQLWLRF